MFTREQYQAALKMQSEWEASDAYKLEMKPRLIFRLGLWRAKARHVSAVGVTWREALVNLCNIRGFS